MAGFKKFGGERSGGGFGGKRSFGGGGSRFGGHGNGPRQMHQATCSQCGQDCEIPFRPTGDRPVFCNNCFKKQDGPVNFAPRKSFGGGSNFGGGSEKSISTDNLATKLQIEQLNIKLDKIMSMLTAPKMAETPKTESPKEKIKIAEKKVATKKVKTVAKKARAKKK